MSDFSLPKVKELLYSNEEEQRLQGVRMLRQAPTGEDLDGLFVGLGDTSWRVRKEAVEAFMLRPRSVETIERVAKQLYSEENAGLRNAAMEILVRLGRQSLEMLHAEVKSEDHDVRKFAVDILGEIGDAESIPCLTEALLDNDENVRNAAAENLGKLRAAKAVPALLDAMELPDVWFRFTILEALSRIGGRIDLNRLLAFKSEPLLRKALFDCLGHVGDESVVPVLVEGLGDEMRNAREAAALALANLGKRSPEPVRTAFMAVGGENHGKTAQEFIAEGDDNLRGAGLMLLGWIGDPRYATPLLNLLDDDRLAQQAADALMSLGASGVSRLIKENLKSDAKTRAILCQLAGGVGCRQATDFLLASAADQDMDVRLAALQAIGQLQIVAGVEQLASALADENEQLRDTATSSLAQIGRMHSDEVLSAISTYFNDDDASLRVAAVSVVGHLNSSEIEKYLLNGLKDVASEVRVAAVRSMGVYAGDGQPRVLRLALTDEDPEVRVQAVEILGRSDDEDVLESLGVALQDEDIWVRAAVSRVLGRFGVEALPLIQVAVKDPIGLVAIAAMETLCDIAPEKAGAILESALDNADEEVVRTAMQLLVRSGHTELFMKSCDRLLKHPHPMIRRSCIEHLVDLEGSAVRPRLEALLTSEEDEQILHQVQDLLSLMDPDRE
ncbi:MAG: hypothetical protein C0624_01700 [Desulfuromonas sp.]|nr:MAG: hypothetical protein C0624_01700 [Desulfuromonas sp.]